MANSFHEAVARYRVQQVKTLLNSVVNVNCRNSQGETVLLQALRIENPAKRRRMFNFLLENGANSLDVDNNTGRDVLAWACLLSRDDQVRKLLKSAPGSFDFKRKDFSGNTALHYAVESRDEDIVKPIAIDMDHYWISVDIPNESGLTPYLLAKKLGLETIADILQKFGRASPRQFDSKTFRDGDAWYKHGKRERRQLIHKRVVSEIKRNGGVKHFKLPPLQDSGNTLPTMRRSDTEVGVWMRLLPQIAKSAPPKVFISAPGSIQEETNYQESNPHEDDDSSIHCNLSLVRNLPSLIDSFTQQLSTSYREAAIPPDPEDVNFSNLPVTTLSMMIAAMKGKAAKSRKKVALTKLSEVSRNPKGKKLGRRDTVSMMAASGGGENGKGTPKLGKMKKHISVTLPALHLQATARNKGH